MRDRERVAITGMGVRAPGAVTLDELTTVAAAGRSTAAPVGELVARGLPVTFGCQVPSFDTAPYVTPREARQLDRAGLLAMPAAADAVADAGLTIGEPDRIGIAVGVGAGGIAPTEFTVEEHHADYSRVSAFSVPRTMANAAAGRIAIQLGARGPAVTYAMACASGTTALGEAMRKIRYGDLDVVVAGGADAPVSPLIVGCFGRLGALSARTADPAAASRPFDAARDGFVMAEGAAFLVLERWSHAVARGARIYGELAGYGANSDAWHIVAPRKDGEVVQSCMALALQDAELVPSDIGHVNAHGTSTPHNDEAEALAIVKCFGAGSVPVTAPKGTFGHSLGASGAVEAVIATQAAVAGQVPPTANFSHGDDVTAQLDVVAGEPRSVPRAPVLSNSFAFGGHNASIVIIPC